MQVPTGRKNPTQFPLSSARFSALFLAPGFSRWVTHIKTLLSALQRGFSPPLQPRISRLAKSPLLHIATLFIITSLTLACRPKAPGYLQGYIEGEYVYVSAPIGGRLTSLSVSRGDHVTSGTPLFALDAAPEIAAHAEAEKRVAQARATLADVQKGQRPTELASLQAQLRQAQANLKLAEGEYKRRADIADTRAISQEEIDRTRSTRDEAAQRVTQIQSDIKTANLGARTDQVAAAQAALHMQEAALTRADWDLAQKSQAAPADALVFDTLFRTGEWIQSMRPVVQLLPPNNLKLRVFIPEAQLASIHTSQTLQVRLDKGPTLNATVNFVSPSAEYTPPVIYSNDTRSKLVYMVEARFSPADAAKLHVGQPVAVEPLQ